MHEPDQPQAIFLTSLRQSLWNEFYSTTVSRYLFGVGFENIPCSDGNRTEIRVVEAFFATPEWKL